MITGSIMWPDAVDTAAELGIANEFARTITASQRAASAMLQAVDDYGYANITRGMACPPTLPGEPVARLMK